MRECMTATVSPKRPRKRPTVCGVSEISGTSTHARATLREDPLDGLQIHLGLARARDAVDEHHVAVGGIAGGGDGVERLLLARGELRLARGNMRCVFVARRQVGIVGAQPVRMAFAGGSEAGASPFDIVPASSLLKPTGSSPAAPLASPETARCAMRAASSENPRMRRRCSMTTAPFASNALSVEETEPS